jgi:hypothetical protein
MVTAMATAMAMARARTTSPVRAVSFDLRVAGRVVVLAAVALWLAYCAFANAVTQITSTSNPATALRFDSRNATALAVYADNLAITGSFANDIARIHDAARMSLQTQALNPRALRQLATFAESGEQPAANAGKLLELGAKLSRRETGTHILQIERLAATDDISSVLEHYDVVLTVDSEVNEKLFPILAAAIEDPAINAKFARYLSLDRPWMPLFVRYKFDHDTASSALESAALNANTQPVPGDFSKYVQYVFVRAIGMNHVEPARRLYSKYRIADPALLTSPAIAPAPEDGRALVAAWSLYQYPDVASEISRDDDAGTYRLRVSAASGWSGVVASKLLMLAPGRYALQADYGEVALASDTAIAWRLKCANVAGQPIIWRSTGGAPQSGAKLVQNVNIPTQCGAQTLELFVAAASVLQDNRLEVTTVSLTPERSPKAV